MPAIHMVLGWYDGQKRAGIGHGSLMRFEQCRVVLMLDAGKDVSLRFPVGVNVGIFMGQPPSEACNGQTDSHRVKDFLFRNDPQVYARGLARFFDHWTGTPTRDRE